MKSGQLIVFPIKMGYITRKPRKMKLQIIMFEIFVHQIGVWLTREYYDMIRSWPTEIL